jgi:drug/metabolite transporter (DMT)-like permease
LNQQRDRRLVHRALIMLVLSATLFGLMAFFAKLAADRLSGAQVATVRFAVACIPFLFVPSFRRSALTFQRLDLLFYRGFFGGLAVLLYFTAIEHIPVGVATLLNYTAPVFSGLFAAMFIGEPVRARAAIPLMIAFAGVVLVVRGHATPGELIGFGRWEAVGLASAVLSGAAVAAIRAARRTEGSWSIYASFSLFGLLATAPFAIMTWRNPTPLEWLLLFAVGVSSSGAQLLMTHAFRWVETIIQGVVAQLAVIISMILGALLLDDRLTPLILLGSALTIGGILAVMHVTSHPAPSGFDEPAEQ